MRGEESSKKSVFHPLQAQESRSGQGLKLVVQTVLWNCQPKSCSRWHQVSSPPPHSSQSQMRFGTLLTFFRVLSSPNTAGSQIRTTTMRQSLFASINGLGNNAQLYLIQEPWCCKQMSLGNRLTQVNPGYSRSLSCSPCA